MRTSFLLIVIFLTLIFALPRNISTSRAQQERETYWMRVGRAVGKLGTVQADGVYKISLPRTDLRVRVGDVEIKPALALGSWLAFRRDSSEVMVMGDLVLTEDEVSAVLTKLQEGGIEQTALHNHVLNETPRIMYMHISAHGDALKLANAIHAALLLSHTPLTAQPATQASQTIELNTSEIDNIMGRSGKVNGGVYQFSIPRAEEIRDAGMVVPPSMGVSTAINFQPTGGTRAAVTGDFVLLASEVNPVIRALRDGGIEVTALHSHMLTEQPRLFFMHFWANDDALKLARTLRTALDRTNSKKSVAR